MANVRWGAKTKQATLVATDRMPVTTDVGVSDTDKYFTPEEMFDYIMGSLSASEADINLLAGASAAGLTDSELLYVNGVTSAIQTQIDAKADTSHSHVSPLTLLGNQGSLLATYVLDATGSSVNGQPTFDISVNIPEGATIIGSALRVGSALSQSASAAYTGGSTQSIGNIAAATNSKVEAMFDPNTDVFVASGATNIRVTADAANFTSIGTVRAITYYQFLSPMADAGI